MEPIGFLFNWVISIQCFFYAARVWNPISSDSNKAARSWVLFFILFGGSTFFGGLSHLLFHYFTILGKIPGWSLAILSMTFLEIAVLQQGGKSKFQALIWFQTAVVFIFLIMDFQFLWVSVQTVFGLLLVLGTVSISEIRRGQNAWKGYLLGIGWILASLPFVIFKIDLSIWFNRHDVSHIFMILCLHQLFQTTKAISLIDQ